jgi:hypothetical protein
MRKKMEVSFLRFTLLVFSLLIVTNAQAHRYWYPGWGWGFGAGFVGGAVIAAPYARPYYSTYPPPVVYQQPVIVQTPSLAYQASPEATPKSSIWYFCESEKNFYPNVPSCPEPWKPIYTDPSSAYVAPPPPQSNIQR